MQGKLSYSMVLLALFWPGSLWAADFAPKCKTSACREAFARCQRGSGLACHTLALEFATAKPKQHDLATPLFAMACARKLPRSCFSAGMAYYYGMGVKKSTPRAIEWLRRGCKLNHGLSCSNLAGVLAREKKSPKEQLSLLERACELRQYDVCQVLEAKGPERLRRVRALYEKMCSAKRGAACTRRGFLAEAGRGQKLDLKEALRWYQKGCALKDGRGCSALGQLYRKALGVVKDLVLARRYYRQGCELHNGFGCYSLAVMRANGTGGPKKPAGFIDAVERACKFGYHAGCLQTGLATLKSGNRIDANRKKAHRAFYKGCKLRSAKSCLYAGLMMILTRLGGAETIGSIMLSEPWFRKACKLNSGVGCYFNGFYLQPRYHMEKTCDKTRRLMTRACKLGFRRACSFTCKK